MKIIYLAGPINGRATKDITQWREEAKTIWPGACLDPMRRDYRGREMEPTIAEDIVNGDMKDIRASDGILVYYDGPSVGTAMEIFYAKSVLKKIVVIVYKAETTPSPWLVHHSDFICGDLQEALRFLRNRLLYSVDSDEQKPSKDRYPYDPSLSLIEGLRQDAFMAPGHLGILMNAAADALERQAADREDAERWRAFISLGYELRAEWASNLSLAPILTQWVDNRRAALARGEKA